MWGILILINTNVGKILELIPILSLLDLFNKNVIRCRVIMFCERLKNPYKGLSNLVGGKIEDGEKGIDAAYRELLEETNISRMEITLHHLMDFEYYLQDCCVEVYVGKKGVYHFQMMKPGLFLFIVNVEGAIERTVNSF